MNRLVIANAVKQSMTSDCMNCRATLAVTKFLFKVVCGIRPDTGGSQWQCSRMFQVADVALHQMRMGMTTYLNVVLSGMVNSAELLPSESSSVTMSCDMLLSASMR